jgi:transcriptional regulator with XRE-family HTH domain
MVRFNLMKSLPNYLQSQRKRLSLSQEEAGFLLGIRGMNKGVKVCRDEHFTRAPSLQDALAYEAIYGRPVRELFGGLYQQAEQEVAARAKILNFRKARKPDPRKQLAIIQLAQKASVNQSNQ